jgi:hypothetical protein
MPPADQGEPPARIDPVDEGEEIHIHIPDLPLPVRIGLLILGWLVVIVGLAGILLPGLQGILLIILGTAILSVASDTVHRWLEKVLDRHPHARERLDSLRRRVRSRLGRQR